jgi:orotate phosphoribosyltransferase
VPNRSSEFIDFLVSCDALTFGDFTAKSGRPTPYFVNAGHVRTGSQIDRMGSFYAAEIMDLCGHDVDVVFGPAYKGIPLAVTTAISLQRDHGRDVGFCFDRKETKDHGEGGTLVGHPLSDGDRVVIVEDVTTAGTSIRTTVPMLRAAAKVEICGLVVGVDRRERGARADVTALDELSEELGFPTTAITTIDDILTHLSLRDVDGRRVLGEEDQARIEAHLATYGVR